MIFRPAACIAILFALNLIHPRPASAAFAEGDAEADRAVSRIESLETISDPLRAEESPDIQCTVDRQWCAKITVDGQTGNSLILLRDGPEAAGAREIGRYPLAPAGSDFIRTLWPRIVRKPSPDGSREPKAMIGVVTSIRSMYSGGGAGAERLSLIDVDTGYGAATFKEVLSVPLRGWALIRACFSEKDSGERAGACHDEYNFSAELTLRTPSSGAPQFNYVTTATSFPGPVSRSEDSLSNPPLTTRDLDEVSDDECSYRRVVQFNPATDRFEFDSPAPDCSEFTAP